MGLVKEYLNSIEGVEIYAIISLIIFFLVFSAIVIHAVRLRKADEKEFSEMPLDDETPPSNQNQ